MPAVTSSSRHNVKDPTKTEFVQFEVGGDHVATITLNRAEKMNAINAEMMVGIRRLWKVVRDEDHIHAVVFRADGNRAFSTGLDRVQGFQYPDKIWNKPDPSESLDPKHHEV
ncbi:enoyl-CoA hydratase/carnithine racemase [Pseudomonas sp. JAI111]|uniref:enoyl-CoA hydratase/isomerase family protein n=1 Tax=Pseudomonas sp. JAI111 TaxID=2735913 RepID=UPI002166EC90|nr:enoyl-CoA hydratase/isomerase family protein [Pseudomonas sp. JAI111]MCS3835658.1 enoyl-CoA hydratase/carnithine racemase [Pseudomonas sp. JAI111]